MNRILQCGLHISITETGPAHATHPYTFFWHIDAGKSQPEAQGYCDDYNVAMLKLRINVEAILSNTAQEMREICKLKK